ncbi:TM2 domain-containing protein [Robbsia andropogonis]|uniref:TM2 domain-containing protein n=1 Tax=Robbsia andropogonis TaxID=28092 RepID=UPI0020A1DC6F|nr:TM2 domain-containing protein [Robbsia andropogonis]MCP1117022.1 TM2 domain-containing protein [Robbsia andropogonis]MCP1126299.1 TM2 domain-containing protein [Robbsia andropogonis]
MTMMKYDAEKKGVGVTYLLWFFLGGLGAHRFYAKGMSAGIVQLALMIFGLATMGLGVGAFVLIALYLWVFVDAFLIPGMIRRYNLELAARLGAGMSSTSLVA